MPPFKFLFFINVSQKLKYKNFKKLEPIYILNFFLIILTFLTMDLTDLDFLDNQPENDEYERFS